MRGTSTGTEWEERYGYSRAIRVPTSEDTDLIVLTGTAPVGADGGVHGKGDAHAQTLRCYEIIEAALQRLGATRACLVRTRMFVTDIKRADEFGRAHRQFFGEHRPCLTMVEVSRLIEPEMLVEIEAEGIVRREDAL